MNRVHPELDDAFVDAQRERLETMRQQTRATQRRADREERRLARERQEPRDIADHGTDLAQQDVDDSVQRVAAARIAEIERALEKIADGTYGLSDASGEPIPRARLEAKPEALRTVEEEEAAARERG
ncbi:MAG TPA: TraR/DksA family transcriptional regulator [Pseudomonadales bacterium]